MRAWMLAVLVGAVGCQGVVAQPGDTPDAASTADSAGGGPDGSPPANGPDGAPSERAHIRCGWIGMDHPEGVDVFVQHADWFDAIHPYWWEMGNDATSVVPTSAVDDPRVIDAAAAHGVRLSPMVDGGSGAQIRAMLATDESRHAHVQNLVAMAVDHGYAGLDIDYEHLWQSSDRPVYTAFIQELAAAMHAEGKEISIAVPALADSGTNNAWDYVALSEVLDRLHIMGYDYHWSGGGHPGPEAPLGWIDAVSAHAAASGHPEKFLLGLPNYCVGAGWYGTLSDCAAACTAPVAPTNDHMQSCSYGVWPDGRSPTCSTASEPVLYFDDTASLEEKVAAARSHSLGGVTYWNLGGEPDGFFEMITGYY